MAADVSEVSVAVDAESFGCCVSCFWRWNGRLRGGGGDMIARESNWEDVQRGKMDEQSSLESSEVLSLKPGGQWGVRQPRGPVAVGDVWDERGECGTQ